MRRSNDGVDQSVFLSFFCIHVIVAVTVYGYGFHILAGLFALDPVQFMLHILHVRRGDLHIFCLPLHAA